MPYKVGTAAGVKDQLQTLLNLASLAGIRQFYLDAVDIMGRRLANDPLEWGDPLFRKPFVNGIVCRALVEPIMVHYSVHELINSVIILKVEPLFEWRIRP